MEYNVAAQIKIYVDNPAALASVRGGLEKLARVQKTWEEDIGFGIKVLKATLLFDDSKGGMDQLEERIRKLGNVTEVEVETVTRV